MSTVIMDDGGVRDVGDDEVECVCVVCVRVCVCWGDGDKSQREVSARVLWSSPSPPSSTCFASTLCQGFILYLVPLGKGFDLTGDEVAVAVVVGVFREIGTFHRCVLHESPRDSSVIIGERGLLPVAL